MDFLFFSQLYCVVGIKYTYSLFQKLLVTIFICKELGSQECNSSKSDVDEKITRIQFKPERNILGDFDVSQWNSKT